MIAPSQAQLSLSLNLNRGRIVLSVQERVGFLPKVSVQLSNPSPSDIELASLVELSLTAFLGVANLAIQNSQQLDLKKFFEQQGLSNNIINSLINFVARCDAERQKKQTIFPPSVVCEVCGQPSLRYDGKCQICTNCGAQQNASCSVEE